MVTVHRTKLYVIKDTAMDAVVAQAFADDEKDVVSLAEDEGFDLEGCEIECVNEHPRTMLGGSPKRCFMIE